MEVVTIIVLGEGDRLSVEGELTVGETVGVATDGATEERVASDVVFERTQAEGHFADFAMDVGDADRGQGRAILADGDFHAAGVGEGVELDRAAFEDAVLATKGEARATMAAEGQESGDQ